MIQLKKSHPQNQAKKKVNKTKYKVKMIKLWKKTKTNPLNRRNKKKRKIKRQRISSHRNQRQYQNIHKIKGTKSPI